MIEDGTYGRTRGGRGKYESDMGGAVMGIGIRVAGVGIAVGLALQPAYGGDRKQASARHAETFNRSVVFAARARSSVSADVPQTMRSGVTSRRGEFSFSPVTPLESRTRPQVQSGNEEKEKGLTSPRERRSVTFFRLDPKFGDISVQPVVGGVNGAQLSVGY
jgi:hypothetical protein